MNFAERVDSGKNPLSRLRGEGCFRDEPSQSPTATALPSGRALGKEGRSRPHLSTAGRSQPISGKLSAPAKASPFRERWHGKAVTERVVSGTNPLSRLRRQLSRRESPWQRGQVSSSFVNDRTNWPVKHKLYASAKASTFGGGGISRSEMTERVTCGTNPLSLAALDSSPEGRALGKEDEFRPHRSTAEEVNR